MSWVRSVLVGVQGAQRPRVWAVPRSVSSAGAEAVDLARQAGLFLDPWQEFVLEHALGETDDGRWAAFEVGLVVSRQNGKGSILEARELAGLFLLGEKFIIHSAHQFDTSLEAFRRLLALIEDNPDFSKRVKRVVKSHGEEGIELRNGQRIRFRTRTKGGGRGFTADCLILDEAMILPEATLGALMPTLSARTMETDTGVQLWYTGSAVDQLIHEDGIVLARIRERGHKGDDPSLAYFEWSVDCDNPDLLEPEQLSDQNHWSAANPGLGIRILADHVGKEYRSMDPRTFAVERLGVGDWPRTDGLGDIVISPAAWAELVDRDSQMHDPICLSFDVNPDRAFATVAAAGLRTDGLPHVEVVDRRRGTGWVVQRLAELNAKWHPAAVVCDGVGPASSLLPELTELRVEVVTLTAAEHAAGCGWLFDAVDQQKLRHIGQQELNAAVRSAVKRPLGDRWAWDRRSSGADISPLVACTLALWGVMREPPKPVPRLVDLDALDDP